MIKRFCELCGNQIEEKDFMEIHFSKSNGHIVEKTTIGFDICQSCHEKLREQIRTIRAMDAPDTNVGSKEGEEK